MVGNAEDARDIVQGPFADLYEGSVDRPSLAEGDPTGLCKRLAPATAP